MLIGIFVIVNLFIICRVILDNMYIDRWLWEFVVLFSVRLGVKYVVCMWYKGYIRWEKVILILINNIVKYWF